VASTGRGVFLPHAIPEYRTRAHHRTEQAPGAAQPTALLTKAGTEKRDPTRLQETPATKQNRQTRQIKQQSPAVNPLPQPPIEALFLAWERKINAIPQTESPVLSGHTTIMESTNGHQETTFLTKMAKQLHAHT